MVRELFPRVVLVTPNLDEAALLVGHAIDGIAALDGAVDALLALGMPSVLLKGGHLPGDEVVDVLGQQEGLRRRYASARIASRNRHGTGCTLSSAIAAHLALGHALPEAVALARRFVLEALAAGAGMQVGGGEGPLNHGFAPVPMHRLPLRENA
jgi:hydroxymethylpyrimidine/phosphomethylpyrimidine kinase